MRVQHNIMAMGAYRNYTNNVAAMKKNLERLSSGYKINRAGDDAAGLAISEKMRAQITGLETAQKNAKDGISLVQTAEGALTEVHDMLNRMVELATQSANGTYDNSTDRYQLQKELDQLKSEINRIADSSNFNGIKLLDGSMDTESHDTVSALQKFDLLPQVKDNGTAAVGSGTIVHTDLNSDDNSVGFSIDLHDVAFTNQSGQTLEILVGGKSIATITGSSEDMSLENDVLDGENLVNKIMEAISAANGGEYKVTIDGQTFEVSPGEGGDSRLTFKLQGQGKFEGMNVSVSASDNSVFQRTTITFNDGLTPAETGTATAQSVSIKTTAAFDFSTKTLANLKSKVDEDAGDELAVTFTISGQDFAVTLTLGGQDGNGYININDDRFTDINDVWSEIISAANSKIDAHNNTLSAGKTEEGNTYQKWGNISDSLALQNATTTSTAITGADIEVKTYEMQAAGLTGQALTDYNIDTTVIKNPNNDGTHREASTVIDLSKIEAAFKEGGSITIGKTEYVFTTDKEKAGTAEGSIKYVDLNEAVDANGKVNLSRIAQLLTDAAGDNTTYTVGYSGSGSKITIVEIHGQSDFVDDEGNSSLTTLDAIAESLGYKTVASTKPDPNASALTLQIGDTADSYNQLKVNIRDMHAESLGLGSISIADQESAAKAVDAIKNAINIVSDVRGTLGATQNRLDHTINNLSVMTENIQDAESTIRDTDIAEEMMAYTKNNILIQSAQAMLAQANQVPQGVLQLLQ